MNGNKYSESAGPSGGSAAKDHPCTSHELTKGEKCSCCICCYPRCLQRFASLKLFIFNACALLCFSAAALAVFEGLVTTIETRYQLSASEIGLSASMFTAGTAVSTTVVTHFGGRPSSRRPAWIAFGGICLSLGAALQALPQFVLSPYQPPASALLPSDAANATAEFQGGLCLADAWNGTGGESSCQEEEKQTLRDNNIAYVIIVIGHVLLGVGYGPLVPLTLAYVDDNAARGTTGLASGILESMMGLGAIIGFQIASAVVSLWVDFYREDAAPPTGLTPHDHGWVGAWWLGMLIEAAIFFLLALPLFGFPRRIPGSHRDDEEVEKTQEKTELDRRDEDGTQSKKVSAIQDLKEWPRSVWRLVKNVTFLLACLTFITEGALVYSLAAFFPKYLQVQFGLHVFSANLIAGFAFVPPWAIGALTSGIIVKKLDLRIPGSAAMGAVSALVACPICVVLIFVGCDNPPIAGVTVGYQGNSARCSIGQLVNLEAPCNSHCLCPSETTYAPYCGPDGVTYFSPCHAGCEQASDNKTYSDCSCLAYDSTSTPSDVTAEPAPSVLTRGHCPYVCSSKVGFVVLMVLWAISLSLATSPRIIIIVSSVHPSDKSLALGISRVFMLLLGSLPFPFLYGACIDAACLVWQTLCGERGSCSVYDIEKFRLIIYGLTTGLIVVQCLAFALIGIRAWIRGRKEGDQTRDENMQPSNGKMAEPVNDAHIPPSVGSQNEAYSHENAF